ncbi:MAG: hypothetical protein ACLR6J_12960 [Parabacteroides merdae]
MNHHGMPRFADATFEAAYPFGQVHLSDRQLPVKVTVKAIQSVGTGRRRCQWHADCRDWLMR